MSHANGVSAAVRWADRFKSSGLTPQQVLAYLRVEWLQSLGVFLGGLGATLLAVADSDIGRWGWLAFLASNVFLIAMAYRKGLWGVLLLQVYFGWTSTAGIWNHIVKGA